VDSHSLEAVKTFLHQHQQHKMWHTLSSLPTEQSFSVCASLAHLTCHFSSKVLKPSVTQLKPDSVMPFTTPMQEVKTLEPLGRESLKKGEVLGILLAGGDGTRLGFTQPKGCFPISPYQKKSLFHLHAERIVALQKYLNCSLPLALLTSPSNHAFTVAYFKQHTFFGLDPNFVFFLTQPTLPLYDRSDNWVFKNAHELHLAPNGNGGLLTALNSQHHCLQSYRYFTVTNIDNVLATLYDLPLLSAHLHEEMQVSLRCFRQNLSPQNVGILVRHYDRFAIVDYTCIKDRSTFPYGNINTLCFSQAFLKRLIQEDTLPIHWVEKKGTAYNHSSKELETTTLLKGEKFLSDTVALADKALALDSAAEDHFAPLKNLTGINDIASVHNALLSKDQRVLKNLIGRDLPTRPIELSMDFHYPDEDLIKKCRELHHWPHHSYLSPENLT
jgi:UDP-N-acetylglucosamine/UDP-N-acetylgalactosamine diphosphorylase